ncbi:MAG: S8 family serine peptidase [Planctomycetota bacterium]
MQLRYASFDPLVAVPELPEALRGDSVGLQIVQFVRSPTAAARAAIAAMGGKVVSYLPDNAYVVRVAATRRAELAAMQEVRWVGAYAPAYRLDPALIAAKSIEQPEAVRYNFVVADKSGDKPSLTAKIAAIGGTVDDQHAGSLLFSATLTGPQLQQVLAFDEVLWIDAWSAPEVDMDNARIQGGGDYIEAQAGYTGSGVGAHIYEGVEATHPDFTGGATNVRSSGAAQSHGHATAGIVFGNGNSNPAVRGMAPDADKFYTNYNSVQGSRYEVVDDLVNIHNVSHTTASWGGGRTFFYTSVSAESDDIVFDHDISWTQSQSNAGNQDSRPQAWAKNIFSIGAVDHFDDSNAGNDSWQAGNASIGPASDGRIKPTLCAYYDAIGTSDRTGNAGYSSGSWSAGFGGTSGATPIVAGHNVIAIEMFTDDSATPGFGRFGNQLRVPGGTAHQNRPHFPTLKALQVVNAAQYSFGASSSDNRREHQGWGFPDLQAMWDSRDRTFVIDEEDVLSQGQVRSHAIAVAPGEASLKICLNWNEPAGNPAAAQQLVNNLSLRVTSPNGIVYWGNNGLESGLWSVAGGSEDIVNSLESVFVQNPAPGGWNVEVIATSVVADNHVETPTVDADYGLVVRGGTGTNQVFATFALFGGGCDSSVLIPAPPCSVFNEFATISTMQAGTAERIYRIQGAGPFEIESIEFYTSSTGGNVTVPLRIYAGVTPGQTPIATGTMTVGPNLGWHAATFSPPLVLTGTLGVGIDTSAGNVYYSEVAAGQQFLGHERAGPGAPWSIIVPRPRYRISCALDRQVAELSNSGLPVLGTSYGLDLSEALPSTFAVLVSGLSDSVFAGGTLPTTLPGTVDCDLFVSPDSLTAIATSAAGTASGSFAVPNTSSLTGLEIFHQWVVLDDQANGIGLVTSNAGRATVGS